MKRVLDVRRTEVLKELRLFLLTFSRTDGNELVDAFNAHH